MGTTIQTEIVRNGWAALAAGELDKLASDYAENMIFVLPGQDDVLEGRAAFRSALDNVGAALPRGFDIKSMTYCTGEDEVVTVLRFTAHSSLSWAGTTSTGSPTHLSRMQTTLFDSRWMAHSVKPQPFVCTPPHLEQFGHHEA